MGEDDDEEEEEKNIPMKQMKIQMMILMMLKNHLGNPSYIQEAKKTWT